MTDLPSKDYQHILDLVTAVLDSGETHLPLPLLAAQLRAAIPHEGTVLFWSKGWTDAPPDDFPLPYPPDAPDSLGSLLDLALAHHPLVRHFATTPEAAPRTLDELYDPDGFATLDERDLVRTVLPTARQLAVPLPAPPGEQHLILLGRSGAPFTDRERQVAARLQPLLAAMVNQQRQLLRRRAQHRPQPLDGAQFALTPRELAVLALLGDTLTAAAIARRLGISPRTVHKHLESIYRKIGTADRLATILRARDLGLLPSPHPRPQSAKPLTTYLY